MNKGEIAQWMLREKVMDYRDNNELSWTQLQKIVYGNKYDDSTHIKRVLGLALQKGEYHRTIRIATATKIARALEIDFHEVDL